MLVVAALLLTGHASEAAAAAAKHTSKKAAKVIATLEMLGIKNKHINHLVEEVDKRVDGKYLRISEDTLMGGPVVLRYHMGSKMGIKQLELHYQPAKDSKFSVSAHTDSVMINYRYEFDY